MTHRVTSRADSRTGLAAILAGLLAVAVLALVPVSAASAAGDPCGADGNKIACENSLPGTPKSVWDVQGSGAADIQGFSTDISVDVGHRIDFKIDTDATAYGITIYRTGYYNGAGAREIATVTPSASLPQVQPQCITDAATALYDCGNWAVSASWDVPSTAVSGVYVARLQRVDNGHASLITFIVRDDSSHSDIVFQTSDPTWQAYNLYGGADFYSGGAAGRAYKVSYNRPITTRDGAGGRDFFFANEYPAVRFLERNGYDVSYIAGVDTDRAGALLQNHRVFLSVGHDEYWSKAQRANVEAARDAGVNLQFLSGNEAYWKTRYEPSADASGTAYRTLVCYKETWANAKIDPSDEWTGTWRDPRLAPTGKGGGRPENQLTGTQFQSNHDDLAVTVSAEEGKLRLWRDTGLDALPAGTTQALAPHTIGYESDEDVDNGFRPAGLIRLSTTTGATPESLQDFGNTVQPGTTTHHLTMYRASSGALVFSTGSIQWSWGLDSVHDDAVTPSPPDARMQQAQVNVMADMGVQPATLMPGLVAATKSTDTTAPTVTIDSPAAGSIQANGSQVTVTGTASDVGGRVAGVEVSTDGGQSWSAATGAGTWSFTYVQHGLGSTAVQARAMDDSANTGAPVTRSFDVRCPCSVLGATVPQVPAANDPGAVELGLRFIPQVDGFVTGVRFYKGAGNTGSHVGSVWSPAGQRLAQVTFSGESATGWQAATFSSAVPVSAGQAYTVSYTAPNGNYAVQLSAFAYRGVSAPPLSVEGGLGSGAAGVFGSPGLFPASTFQKASYFVDPVFTTADSSPLVVTNQWPLPGTSSVPASTTVTAKFSRALSAAGPNVTVKDQSGTNVPGTTGYDSATRVATFTPTNPLGGLVTYTVTVAGTDLEGGGVTSGGSWQFTTARPPGVPGVCPCTLFDESLLPTVLDSAESTPVTLGVRFSSSQAGTITGLRFYKGPNNTGVHTGSLWAMDGTELAQGTFAGESTSGWETLTFAQPYPIAADTEYVVSYRSPTGSFSLTPNAFAAADLSRAPLRVAPNSGAYTYAGGFPGFTSASNYLVDPVFAPPPPPLSIASQDPAPGAVNVPRATPVTVTFSDPVRPGATMTATQQPSGTSIAGTTALDATGTRLVFTPSALMPPDTDIRVSLSGVTSVAGANLAPQAWTFHTRAPDPGASQSLFGDYLPTVASAPESSPVELGTAFSASKTGTVTAIRFFKAADNLGVHTGSLWSATGTRLATVTFGNETATGWQTAVLAQPVTISAGTTYVVSYYAPQGHFSSTPGFLTAPFTSGDLTARGTGNGLYTYGTGGGFPTTATAGTNFFVDVVYAAPTIATVGQTPAPGATGIARDVQPSITVSAPVGPGWSMTVKQGTTTIAGTASLSSDQKTLTFKPSAVLPADADLTVTVAGVVSTAGAVLATQSWTFHTTDTTSLFTGVSPSTVDTNDKLPVELGVAFSSAVNGNVTQIRFYKAATNTGTHTGSLWSSTGTRLATVTFTNESASGWQTATFSTPVPIVAGQTYVASYYAPKGHYSSTPNYFKTVWKAAPLTAPATTNGRYRYATGGGFPTTTNKSTNYFVDVVFRPTA
ncbi:DUF4082 domain-containing protein [Nocardioides sp. LS1]|uniref:DUF4082 domain-containing protein n=1 Tax=Nocardioides sp. LS1 TaxID=1027620 RepID=UPI0021AB7529|nr:DUF4082 domain-containing protein [Nocardioides sp. LS1]